MCFCAPHSRRTDRGTESRKSLYGEIRWAVHLPRGGCFHKIAKLGVCARRLVADRSAPLGLARMRRCRSLRTGCGSRVWVCAFGAEGIAQEPRWRSHRPHRSARAGPSAWCAISSTGGVARNERLALSGGCGRGKTSSGRMGAASRGRVARLGSMGGHIRRLAPEAVACESRSDRAAGPPEGVAALALHGCLRRLGAGSGASPPLVVLGASGSEHRATRRHGSHGGPSSARSASQRARDACCRDSAPTAFLHESGACSRVPPSRGLADRESWPPSAGD